METVSLGAHFCAKFWPICLSPLLCFGVLVNMCNPKTIWPSMFHFLFQAGMSCHVIPEISVKCKLVTVKESSHAVRQIGKILFYKFLWP